MIGRQDDLSSLTGTILGIGTDFGFKLVANVVPFAVRRFYKVERLREKVIIRVEDAHEGITITGGELPRFSAWLRISNFSPLEMVVDRLFGELYFGSQLASFQFLHRHLVPMSSETTLQIQADLTPDHVAHIRRNLHQNFTPELHISGFLHTRLHSFAIQGRTVKTKNFRLLNIAAADVPRA